MRQIIVAHSSTLYDTHDTHDTGSVHIEYCLVEWNGKHYDKELLVRKQLCYCVYQP